MIVSNSRAWEILLDLTYFPHTMGTIKLPFLSFPQHPKSIPLIQGTVIVSPAKYWVVQYTFQTKVFVKRIVPLNVRIHYIKRGKAYTHSLFNQFWSFKSSRKSNSLSSKLWKYLVLQDLGKFWKADTVTCIMSSISRMTSSAVLTGSASACSPDRIRECMSRSWATASSSELRSASPSASSTAGSCRTSASDKCSFSQSFSSQFWAQNLKIWAKKDSFHEVTVGVGVRPWALRLEDLVEE